MIPLPGQKKGQEPEEPTTFTFEDFGGLDTKGKRPAINPKDFSAIENWMPIGAGNLRTLWDREEEPLYETSGGRVIIYYVYYNLGADRFCAVFLDDGTAVQVNTSDGSTTTISAVANTFWDGEERLPHAVQYQAKYLLITSKVSDDAYWAWDGTSLFAPGTLAPQVLLTNSGGGTYVSAPTVTAYGGAGSGATFAATLDAQGHVVDVDVTNPGSGYDHEDLVTLIFTGGGVSQDQARATATVSASSAGVALVLVTNGGSGYTSPLVAFAGGGGAGAEAFVSGVAAGVITDITVTNPGSGYTSIPTITITDGGAGAGATAVAQIKGGQITGITVNSGGSGYVGNPDVLISAPNNTVFPNMQAEATCTVVAGAVTAITVRNPGFGYRSASVQLSGGNGSAEAEVTLMPFGMNGTCLETYQERVWLGDDTRLSWTGADSIRDFSSAGGGGSKPLTQSNLRERLVALKEANGFLYRLGDSSINVISNVQTSATGVTTFNDANVDNQIGTAWRDSVQAFGRALVFANPTGFYALFGGGAEKTSPMLDGLFATASFNTGASGLTPTSASATIFGIRVYACLITAADPLDGEMRNLICMWDGQRWWLASQSLDAKILAGQEISSELSAWGASDSAIHALFTTPSEDLEKTFQTKLAGSPSYIIVDQVTRAYYIAQIESGVGGDLIYTVDNQAGAQGIHTRSCSADLIFIGPGPAPITWTGLASAPLAFTSRGLVIDGFDDATYGNLIGLTVSTSIADLTLISASLLLKPYAPQA